MTASAAGLSIRLDPIAGRVTTARMSIAVDGSEAWPVAGAQAAPLDIQIDDLLSHLTDFWKPLLLRQVYPLGLGPWRPSDLRRDAERRWRELPPAVVAREEDVVAAFEGTHDLSRAFAGLFELPPFWLVRSGDHIVVETAGRIWRLPFADVRDVLTAIGDSIARRLSQDDPDRWRPAETAWSARDRAEAWNLLAWSAGLDPDLATSLIAQGALAGPRDFEDAANDDDEMTIAARVAGALPPEQIGQILRIARGFGRTAAPDLDRLARECVDHVSGSLEREVPHSQGETVARLVRDRLLIPVDAPVDVFQLVRKLGVDLRCGPTEPLTLDGLAIWGSRHGPGVFLNEASSRMIGHRQPQGIAARPGARVTLAHELCHLLLDGSHAASAVEILKARMPAGVEQRAKSFAGELLLPTGSADRQWQDEGRPADRVGLNSVVEALAVRYGVTRSVAAWKVEHAARNLGIELGAALDAIAPRR